MILGAEQLITQPYGQGTINVGSKFQGTASNAAGQEMPEYRHLTCYMQLAVTDYCVEFPLWIREAFQIKRKQNKQQQKKPHPTSN